MTKDGKPRPLAAIVGERLKEFRAEKDLRQDDVAEAAKFFGLTWGRSSIAALEGGNRELKLDEVVLLGAIIKRLGGWDKALIPPDEQVLLGEGSWIEARRIGPAISAMTFAIPLGGVADSEVGDRDEDGADDDGDEFLKLGSIESEPKADPFEQQKSVASHIIVYDYLGAKLWRSQKHQEEVDRFLGSELARRVAERLTTPDGKVKIDHVLVETISIGLWGANVTEERDRRTAQRGTYETKRALQSARGHVTREMIDELQVELSNRWPEICSIFDELEQVLANEKALAAWVDKVYAYELEVGLARHLEGLEGLEPPRRRSFFSRGKHRG